VFVPAPPDQRGVPTRSARQPLIVTREPALLDELVRVVAAAGADATVVADAEAARAAWPEAPCIVVGVDVVAELTTAALQRRSGVIVATLGALDLTGYPHALALGAEDVLDLHRAQRQLIERLADAIDGSDRTAHVIGVIGGRGGAGATTLAVALAVTGQRIGVRTMLVDADPLGGGIDLAVGAEHSAGLRWPDLATTTGRVSASSLAGALVRAHEFTILSVGRGEQTEIPPAAMHAALEAGCRSHDLLVVDLPRHIDDAASVALHRTSTLLLVTPAEVRAAAASRHVVAKVGRTVSDVRVVVRGPAPADLGASAVAELLELPLAGELRPEPRLASGLERGQPPGDRSRGPLGRFCARLLAADVPTIARAVAA
jgi:secretion/DNA translocation related CpaE-like protein